MDEETARFVYGQRDDTFPGTDSGPPYFKGRAGFPQSAQPDTPAIYVSSTERMFPAGSVNQAIFGPGPLEIPFSFVRTGPSV